MLFRTTGLWALIVIVLIVAFFVALLILAVKLFLFLLPVILVIVLLAYLFRHLNKVKRTKKGKEHIDVEYQVRK